MVVSPFKAEKPPTAAPGTIASSSSAASQQSNSGFGGSFAPPKALTSLQPETNGPVILNPAMLSFLIGRGLYSRLFGH